MLVALSIVSLMGETCEDLTCETMRPVELVFEEVHRCAIYRMNDG
jgi:hypothetical protein